MVVALRFRPSGICFCAESVSTASFDNSADDDWNACQRMRIENHNLYLESIVLASAIPSYLDGQPTGKSLLDIDHLPGTCLHESTIPSSGPF